MCGGTRSWNNVNIWMMMLNCTEVSAFAINNFTVTCYCLSSLCQLSISAHTSLSVATLSAQYLSTHVTVCRHSVCSVSQHTCHCLLPLSAQYLSTHFTVCTELLSYWDSVFLMALFQCSAHTTCNNHWSVTIAIHIYIYPSRPSMGTVIRWTRYLQTATK